MNVLAISAHPDDETLGCGGTLLRHRAEGDDLFWVVTTEAHEPQWSAEEIEQAARQVEQVADAYEMQEVHKLGFPTIQLDTVPQADLIGALREVIEAVRPEVVYLVRDGDVHTDHHAVYTAAMSVMKSFYMRELGVRRVLAYETLSSTEAAPPQPKRAFLPTVYRDVTPHLERKIEIMRLFETEAQPDDLYPRGDSALRALARYRGATAGVEYAEAFSLVREVD